MGHKSQLEKHCNMFPVLKSIQPQLEICKWKDDEL